MSQLQVTKDEFGDTIVMYLLEVMRDDEFSAGNEKFRGFVDFLSQRGVKPTALKYYLNSEPDTRMKFKKVKDELAAKKDGTTSIVIGKNNLNKNKSLFEDFDRVLCKRVFRKVKEVRFKTSKPITEERLDKIIDYCINEQEEQNNG